MHAQRDIRQTYYLQVEMKFIKKLETSAAANRQTMQTNVAIFRQVSFHFQSVSCAKILEVLPQIYQ